MCRFLCVILNILTQTVEGEVGLIGTEFSFKEAASIYEVAGEALALKNSVQVHTCKEMNTLQKKKKSVIDHTETCLGSPKGV